MILCVPNILKVRDNSEMYDCGNKIHSHMKNHGQFYYSPCYTYKVVCVIRFGFERNSILSKMDLKNIYRWMQFD